MYNFQKYFRRNFLLRYHMGLLLLATALSGVLANKFLYEQGMRAMWLRHPVSVLISYITFLILLRLWLSYVGRVFDPNRRTDLTSDKPAKKSSKSTGESFLDGLSSALPGSDSAVAFLIVLIVLCIFGGAAFLIYEAPVILTEAAFQFLLAAGLVRPFKRLESPNWTRSILSTTWKPFAVIFLMAVFFSLVALANCPASDTILKVSRSCDF